MNTYLLEGLAPLVFRSGKPFGAQAGADGAQFPLPSSAAGLMRTLYADQEGVSFDSDADMLRRIECRGPLLARREISGTVTPLLAKPADALYLRDDNGQIQVLRLSPCPIADDMGCDLPAGLLPVQLTENMLGKPAPGPQYWAWQDLQTWQSGGSVDCSALSARGLTKLAEETRTHVALDDHSLAADPGRLFKTGGIDLGPARLADGGWETNELVFIAKTDTAIQPTLATFGGERRISRLHAVHENNNVLPECSSDLSASLRSSGGLKLTLLTPAIFSNGYLPGWLNSSSLTGTPPGLSGVELRLRAVAIDRWLPVSGWDLLLKRPKAMRKAVAAGAVYWFDIVRNENDDWVNPLWLNTISDTVQDRCDGFGMVLPSAWQPV